MQLTFDVVELSTKGLKKELRVTVPAGVVAHRVEAELKVLGRNVKLQGFRKGHVPAHMLKQYYGQEAESKALQKIADELTPALMRDQKDVTALAPDISLESADSDLVFKYTFETLPTFDPLTFADLHLERRVIPVEDKEVEETLKKLAEGQKVFKTLAKQRAIAKGDVAKIGFKGTLKGKAIEGAQGTGYELEIGSGSFVPGFEDQLIGHKKGDHVTLTVTFPEKYHAPELAGKPVVFEVDIEDVGTFAPANVDDALAAKYAQKNLDDLKALVRGQLEQERGQLSRLCLKQALLEKLAQRYDFEVPEGMIALEKEAILRQMKNEAARVGEEWTEADEKEAQSELGGIAKRRVMLGLVLADVGKRHGVKISDEELSRVVANYCAQNFPGEFREAVNYFYNTPSALAQLQAPLMEEKIIDYIVEHVQLKDKKTTVEEAESHLNHLLESYTGDGRHDGCCDVHHGSAHKPAAKPKAKAEPAEKSAKTADKAAAKPKAPKKSK